MSKKWKLLALLLTISIPTVWAFHKGRQAAHWRAEWAAVQQELELIGFVEMDEGKPEIEDLPDGAQAGGVLEGEVDATETATVHKPVTVVKWKTKSCPLPPENELTPALQDCQRFLNECEGYLRQCPTKPWLLRASLTPATLGARCRAEWVHAPGGKVNGRLFGAGRLQLSDGLIEGEWKQVDTFTIAQVAKQEKKKTTRWALMVGLHVQAYEDSFSGIEESGTLDGVDLSPQVGLAWWKARRDGSSHKRLGWYALANGSSLDSLGASGGLAVTW